MNRKTQISLILAAVILSTVSAHSLPVPSRNSDPMTGQSAIEYMLNAHSPQPPQLDGKPCPLGSCGGKGKWCELICRNNPNEGGKFCNCDTYALRSNGLPGFADCNRL